MPDPHSRTRCPRPPLTTRVARLADRPERARISGLPVAASLLAMAAALLVVGCGEAEAGPDSLEQWEWVELATPTAQGAGEPNLFTAPDGRVYLSWIEPAGENEHAVRFSMLDPTPIATGSEGVEAFRWSEPRTIARGENFFVNWADFPSVFVDDEGRILAHWLVRSGSGPVDYDVHLAWSLDGGESWSDPIIPHRDGTFSEHGFVSLFPLDDGSVGAVWLDGRHFAGWDEEAGAVVEPGRPDDPQMSLRFTALTPEGPGDEVLLDGRICDCCQTSAAVTDRGPVVVYRDRTEDEIRDISIVRLENGSWTEPVSVHDDGWRIPACPVNGPMVDARGSRVAVAWFTAADDKPLVRLAFSGDGGHSFDLPVRVDDGSPVGRVDVVLDEDGRAYVSWLERVGEGAELRVRWVERDGKRGRASTVTRTAESRASGFPRMTVAGNGLLFAWTDVDGSDRVEVAVIRPGVR